MTLAPMNKIIIFLRSHEDLAIWTSLSIAVLIGVFLRFYNLDLQGLWVDEIHTLGPALHAFSLSEALWNYVVVSPTPPLYYYFMILWTEIFGYSEYLLRIPATISGVLVIVVYWFGLNKIFPRQVAATATILMAMSWPAIYYSQEVRTYSTLLLFTTWAAVIWMSILKEIEFAPAKSWWWMLFASFLASMSHPFGFMIAAFMFFYLFLVSLKMRAQAIRTFIVGALLAGIYGAWTVVNLTGMDWLLGESNTFSSPGLEFFLDVGAFLFHHPIPAILVFGGVSLLGGMSYCKNTFRAAGRLDWTAPEIYLPIIMAVPFFIVFAAAQYKAFMYSRYLIVFLPFIYCFFAHIISARNWESKASAPVTTTLLVFLASFWIFPDHYLTEKPQTREMVRYVLTEYSGEDVLLTGCEKGSPFDCAIGPGKKTDADWSKYLFYLNYDKLPATAIVPDVYNSFEDLDKMYTSYLSAGKKRIIFMGSRAGEIYVADALKHLKSRLGSCRTRSFHLAIASICQIN
jgi:4-amino-4-deoxy-L-arabinose transferase-like glycosyltransferase